MASFINTQAQNLSMSLVRAEALMHKSGTILTRAVVHPGHMTLTFGLIHHSRQ